MHGPFPTTNFWGTVPFSPPKSPLVVIRLRIVPQFKTEEIELEVVEQKKGQGNND